MEDQLILVDSQDMEIGSCAKMEAHERALLHRAFSIFIFRKALVDNPDGSRTFRNQLLIQRRAAGKYHSAGFWANSCCSHPRAGESLEEATSRRLKEETGIDISECTSYENIGIVGKPDIYTADELANPREELYKLEEKGSFIYKAEFDNGLTEYEFDHVFVGWLREIARPEVVAPEDVAAEDAVETSTGSLSDWHGRNPEEADEMLFVDVDYILKDVSLNAYRYAAWFMPALMIATEGAGFEEINRETVDRIIY